MTGSVRQVSQVPQPSRRAFCTGLAASAAGALVAACSSGTTAGSASAKTATIEFWSDQLPGTPVATRESAFFRAYERAHQGIKINEHRLSNFDAQYKAALGAQQASDVASLNVQYLRDYVRLGLVDDISDVLAPVESQYVPMSWTQMHTIAIRQGHFGLPLYMDTCGVYYNKQIFSKLGLTIPTTWDEMRAITSTLNGHGIAPIVYAGAEPWWNPMWFNLFFYQETDNNGIAVNDQMMRGQTSFHSAPFTQAIADVVALDRDKVLMHGNQGFTLPTATAAFVQGKAAMYYMGSWFTASLPAGFDYGIFPTPVLHPSLKSQPPGSVSGIYTISSSSQNRPAAADLVRAMTGPAFQTPQMQAPGAGVPLQPSELDLNRLPAMRELEAIAPSTVVWLDALWEPEVITAVQQGVQAAIVGTKTPSEVTSEIAGLYKTLRSEGRTYE